jgi:hypothetical protein
LAAPFVGAGSALRGAGLVSWSITILGSSSGTKGMTRGSSRGVTFGSSRISSIG